MAEQRANKDNKNVIIGVCAAVIVLVVVIVAVVLATGGIKGGIDDSYFVSDDTKYVLTAESDEMLVEEGEEAYAPIRTHVVYTYSGDEITGMKTYAEYADNAAAKAALDAMVADGQDTSSVKVDGKYLVQEMDASAYEGVTASDVKQTIELMETLKNMSSGDGGMIEDTEGTEVVETTSEE